MLACLIALGLAQEIPSIGSIPIQVSELQFPVFGGPQEMILGVKKQSRRTMGFFVNTLEAGQYGDKQPINYIDARVGYASWAVTASVLGSTPGYAITCESNRNQSWEWRKKIYGLRHRGSRTWYLDESGKLLAETCDLEMATGRWTMDVTYGAEDFTVTISSPKQPRKTMTVNPGCGIEALTIDPFRPMLRPDPTGKESEVLLKEKEFYLLDPLSASPTKYKARISGSFGGEMFDKKWTGREVEIVGGPEKQTAWISHSGVWLKHVLGTPGAFLILDQKPD